MHYDNIVEGTFIARPNRFVAKVSIYGVEETVHVKNTGRCKELLIPGARVFLQDFRNNMGNRKLRFSLISVEKTLESDHDRQNDKILINMDSQIPNKVIEEALFISFHSFFSNLVFSLHFIHFITRPSWLTR